ncbi:PH-like domain-containing protein [Devriesea agamarum]|uniref:PH-like domain-containing protein n=1 Tax=Devriesea agamarum TaxID=472569 RepID=UPI00071D57D5|nr:hypothetical protein [Devriesea agamarum]
MSPFVAPIALLCVVLGVILGAMARGWYARGVRQRDLPAPPDQSLSQVEAGPYPAIYVSSTTAGKPLERIVAHGLGSRSRADISLGLLEDGHKAVRIDRYGAPSLTIPMGQLQAVGSAQGIAGKAVGPQGLFLLTWNLGPHTLDSGLRLQHRADHRALLAHPWLIHLAVDQLPESPAHEE